MRAFEPDRAAKPDAGAGVVTNPRLGHLPAKELRDKCGDGWNAKIALLDGL